jgi:hypothetical protein
MGKSPGYGYDRPGLFRALIDRRYRVHEVIKFYKLSVHW